MGDQLARWVEFTADASRQPISAFPTLNMLSMLSSTFEAAVDWHWMAATDQVLVVARLAVATDPTEALRQLSIPVAVTSGRHGVFIVSRGRDFSADQFVLARQLQPLLMLLEAQSRRAAGCNADLATHFQLTARESSVRCPPARAPPGYRPPCPGRS